jgi:outer membrane protein TolC
MRSEIDMTVIRKTALFTALACLASPAFAQPLSLEHALGAAETQSPRLQAQRSAVVSADQQAFRSTELPDPKLRFGIENLPVTGADRFRYDRDFMTMRAVGLMQEFPNQAKRAARGQRAVLARGVEQAMLGSQRAMLHRDVASAWLEVHFAERATEAAERLAGQLSSQSELASAALARGRQSVADSLQLRLALEQARDRLIELGRAAKRARIALAALIAEDAQRPLAQPPDLNRLEVPREALLNGLHEHPHLRVYDVREDLSRAEVQLARAGRRPDWSLEVGYGHRGPQFDNMLTVMVAIDLPWQAERRQDRDIAARLAEVEQSRAQREEARRVHEAELRSWLADYDAAAERLGRYESVILPLARDRHDAALAAYRGGRGELNPVLEASRGITDAEIALISVQAERAKAWANLSFLYPHEAH